MAIGAGALQKTGGNFTLSAPVDFGPSFGIKAMSFTTETTNPSTGAALNLSVGNTIGWRNNANAGNLLLGVNGSDQLTFNGVPIGGSGIFTASRAVVTDSSGNLATSTTTATEIGYLSGVTSAIQTQLNAKATGTITAASANQLTYYSGATTLAGLAALTAFRALISDTNGLPTVSPTTSTELGFVSGVTSAIQTQLNTKIDTAGTGLSKSGTTLNISLVPVANGGTGVTTSTGTGSVVLSNSPTLVTPALGTPSALVLTNATGLPLGSTGVTGVLTVPNGGTGDSTLAAHGVLIGNGTGVVTVSGAGASGQVLTSNGASADPTFQNVAGTGTVNSGTQYQLAYYATSTNAVSGDSSITTNASNQLLVTDGTVSLPAISFTSNPNTGMYKAAANEIGFATGGAITLGLNGSGQALFTAGAAATPSISFLADTASGMYELSTSDVGFATASTLRMHLTTIELRSVVDFVAPTHNNLGSATDHWGELFVSTIAAFTAAGNISFSSTSTQGIVGTTTNDSAAAGNVGEFVQARVTTSTNFPTTNQWGDLTSISLTAGDWDVTGVVSATINASTTTSTQMGISTTTGNSTTGLQEGDNQAPFLPPTSNSDSSGSVPSFRMSLSGTTTVYLKYLASYSAGTPKAFGRMSARRIR